MSFENFMDGVVKAARQVRNIAHTSAISSTSAGEQEPVSDPYSSSIDHLLTLASSCTIKYGMIIDAVPFLRSYRVSVNNGGGVILCALGMSGPVGPIGAYDASTLTVGTGVFFVQAPGESHGVIISADPAYMTDPSKCLHDIISQGSNTGIIAETGLQEPLNMGGSNGTVATNGGVVNWSGRTPADSLEIGEFSRISELGLAIHLDSYMSFLRADEYTGIWAFYWDGLCRVAGHQFQEWAGPSEREIYDDEGETMYYHGIATYPWEHRGMLIDIEPTGDAYKTYTADESQNTYKYYAANEPKYDDQQPFHRFRTYAGYLGQGQKKLVCAPDIAGGTEILQYSNSSYEAIGLHEQQITMAGHFGIRSAVGITIAKRPVIPVPKRTKIVTSQNGDTPANYKASSKYGDGGGTGVAHAVQPTPDASGPPAADVLALYRAATVMDLHAHLFNWEGMHPFYYHENDYALVEESSYSHVTGNQEVPTWSQLNSTDQWYMNVPTSDTLYYDHRGADGTVKVYRNTAYFTITDEGGISIGDGWGSEIRMVGGDIFLECPGDVFMAPGRNLIAWGGRDICLRAWNCMDITANVGDVRIKAEENLNMLGGNSGGPYGVFIESRGEYSTDSGESIYGWQTVGEGAEHTGIVLKAKNSEIIGWGRSVYFMTKMDNCLGKDQGQSDPGTQPKTGDIVFDTKGEGDVITRSKFVKHWAQCGVMHAFPAGATTRQVNMFTEDGTTLCNDVFIDGDLLNYGSHLARNDIISCQGHFASSTGGMVAKGSMTSVCNAIDDGHTYEADLRTWSTAKWAIDLQAMWYSTGRPGNPDVVQSAWFDLRVQEDYKSNAFTLWEARWQQMARENGDSLNEWEENPVASNEVSPSTWENTYPFPGYERLVSDSAWNRVTNSLYNTSTGTAVDRGSSYESPVTLNAAATAIIDGNYTHIGK